MEAQAAAQRMASQQAAAQQAAQQAAEVAALHALNPDHHDHGVSPPPASPPRNGHGHVHLLHHGGNMSDEPTDLSMDAEEKRSRMHDRIKRRIANVGDLARLTAGVGGSGAAGGEAGILVKEERDRERRGESPTSAAAARFYDNY